MNHKESIKLKLGAKRWKNLFYSVLSLKGGPGSGHHGHAGRPGFVGGSAPEKGGGGMGGAPAGSTRGAQVEKRLKESGERLRAYYARVYELKSIVNRHFHYEEGHPLHASEAEWKASWEEEKKLYQKIRDEANTLSESDVKAIYKDMINLQTVIERGREGNMVYLKDEDAAREFLKGEDGFHAMYSQMADNMAADMNQDWVAEIYDGDMERARLVIKTLGSTANGVYPSLCLQETASKIFHSPMSEWQKKLYKESKKEIDLLREAGEKFDHYTADYHLYNFFSENGIDHERVDTMVSWFDQTYRKGENPEDGWRLSSLGGKEKRTAYLTGCYERTQNIFKERGFNPEDEIMVFRGFGRKSDFDESTAPPITEIGNKIKYRGNALESWSISSDVAGGFGPVMFGTKVKIKDIFSIPMAGAGDWREGEIIVLGRGIKNAFVLHTLVGQYAGIEDLYADKQ